MKWEENSGFELRSLYADRPVRLEISGCELSGCLDDSAAVTKKSLFFFIQMAQCLVSTRWSS
jgi:hypothetical protein